MILTLQMLIAQALLIRPLEADRGDQCPPQVNKNTKISSGSFWRFITKLFIAIDEPFVAASFSRIRPNQLGVKCVGAPEKARSTAAQLVSAMKSR